MSLTDLEEIALTRGLLKQLRWRLLDKPGPVLPRTGQYYFESTPHDRAAIGAIGHLPDADEVQGGYQPVPNSMGLVFLVAAPANGPIVFEVQGRCDLEYAYIPDYEQQFVRLSRESAGDIDANQTLVEAYKRYTVAFKPARFVVAPDRLSPSGLLSPTHDTLQAALKEHMEILEEDPRVYRRLLADGNSPHSKVWLNWNEDEIVDQETLNAAVKSAMFEWNSKPLPYALELLCEVRRAPDAIRSEPGREEYLVKVYLTNNTTREISSRYRLKQHRIMDTNLSVRIVAGEHQQMRFRVAPDEYHYEPVQRVDGYGVTCALVKDADGTLRTDSLPVYEQPWVEAPEPAEVGMREGPEFDRLAREPLPVLDDFLGAMQRYAREWNRAVLALEQSNAPAAEHARRDFSAFESEIQRVACGIGLLREQPTLLRAFSLMNETMLEAVKIQRKPFQSWRLFQLGFILTQVAEVARRVDPKINPLNEPPAAEVLWVPTGGGKTEAFLGLIVMSMFYQRLMGRTYGVSAWMRSPLRMLSVQQFQRLAYVIGAANRLRRREQLPGFAFSIGYYTGKGTPNRISSRDGYALKHYLPNMLKRPEWLDELRFIDSCPHCTGPVRVELVPENFRIKHVCNDSSCWSNQPVEEKRKPFEHEGELGIYVSDEECYRYLPTVLLGTLDKLVVLGHQRQFHNLFGACRWFCPDHGFTPAAGCRHLVVSRTGDEWNVPHRCPNNSRNTPRRTFRVEALKDPGFSFILNDEQHLLKEDLGTFYSHYDSALVVLQRGFPGGQAPKILGATATIRDLENQALHQYLLHARRFPAGGMGLDSSFYSRIKRDPKTQLALVRRFYVGALPTNTSQGGASEWVCDANERYHELINECCRALRATPHIACEQLGLDPARANAAIEHIESMRSLSLVYARRIIDADHVEQRFETDNERLHKAGRAARMFARLDGHTSLADIQKVIARIQAHDPNDPIHQVVATSVVSHGVDVAEINMLFFTGCPTSTAEAIQAGSRAGRVRTGIVITAHNARNLYEASIFRRFTEYHRFIDRLVEATPINRFAAHVRERTLPGILHAVILNWARHQPWGARIFTSAKSLSRALTNPGASEALVDKVVEALGFGRAEQLGVFNARQVREACEQARKEITRLVALLRGVQARYATAYIGEAIGRLYGQKPMESLRDVERQISVKPGESTDEKVLEALGFGASMKMHIPYSRLFYENFLPGAPTLLRGGAYGLVVGTDSDAEKAQKVNPERLRDVMLQHLSRWRNVGGEVDEILQDAAMSQRLAIRTPTSIYVSPTGLLECSGRACRVVDAAQKISRQGRVLNLSSRIVGQKPLLACRICGGRLKQLPFVQLHSCGHLADIEPPRKAQAQMRKLRFHSGGSFARSYWSDATTRENLGSAYQGRCPVCNQFGEGKPAVMSGNKVSGGRSKSFFSQLLQFVELTGDTTQLLSAFRAANSNTFELGRAVLCALLGLQRPQQLRSNFRMAVSPEGRAHSDAQSLRVEYEKLVNNIARLSELEDMENVVSALQEKLTSLGQKVRLAEGLFSAALAYLDNQEVLRDISRSQRAAEAALLRGEFHEQSLEADIASALPARQVLLQDTKALLLRHYGIREVVHFEDLAVVVAATGFTRQFAEPSLLIRDTPLRLNAFTDDVTEGLGGKVPVYALPTRTEGILVRLDPCKILCWAIDNLHWAPPPEKVLTDAKLAHAFLLNTAPALVLTPDEIRQCAVTGKDRHAIHLLGLMHSLVHAALRSAHKDSGYESNSLVEYLFPIDFSALIYVSSRKDFHMGGLQTLYQFGLQSWFEQAALSALTCVFEPLCSSQGSSCHGCLQLPLGCETYNHGVSRSYLVGGTVTDVNGQTVGIPRGFWT